VELFRPARRSLLEFLPGARESLVHEGPRGPARAQVVDFRSLASRFLKPNRGLRLGPRWL